MNATLAPARPESAAGRTMFVALAAREMHRFVVNPVFLFAVVMTAWTTWDDRKAPVTGVGTGNWYPWIFLGGFGMMATFWLTRSMRDSEPVVGVTPTTLPARTAALCTVAVVPFLCGVLTLFAFLHFHPVGARVYGAFSPPAQVAVLVGQIAIPSLGGQIAIPSLGGPLLGVALGRWVRFPGAALVLFLVIFGWVNVATFGSLWHPDSAAFTALRLFSPFAFFTYMKNVADVTTWRGSPWFFIGWQLALCATAVVALLRGADGRARFRSPVPFRSSWCWRRSCSYWLAPAGSPTRSPRDGRTGAAGRGMASGRGHQQRGSRGGRPRRRVPGGCHHAVADLLRAARRRRGVHPRRAGQPGRRRDADRARPAHQYPRSGAAGAARRRRAGNAGGGNARTGAALDGGRSRAGRQRAARIRRGMRDPDADRGTGPGNSQVASGGDPMRGGCGCRG